MTQLSETQPTREELEFTLGEFATQLEEFRALHMLKKEDEGWKLLSGGQPLEDQGPDLTTLRDKVSHELRVMVSGNPLMKKARLLRQSYIWSDTPHIPNSQINTGTAGRKSELAKFVNNPRNQSNVFDSTAHEKMESAVITDGCYLLIGKTSTKELRPIPLTQISAIHVDSEFPDEILAYQRTWSKWNPAKKRDEEQVLWYYVNTVPTALRVDEIDNVKVSTDSDMLDFWVNKQVGWPLGLPDGVAGAPWAQMYVELMQNGRVMTDALAQFAAKVTSKNPKTSAGIGVKVAKKGTGQLASMAQGNEMEIFSSAGKTYDFNGIRPVAALVAAAMEVSIVHLLSDPGAAGSSYGSAANLDRPTKNAIKQRQDAWVVFLKRVIKWGTKLDVEVTFPPLDEENYRRTQQVALADKSGLFHDDEMRTAYSDAAGIKLTHEEVPERLPLDQNGSVGVQAGSPDQGRSNGTGGIGSTGANDLRDDVLTAEQLLESLEPGELVEILKRLV